jgi:hypothetical protein
MRCKLLNLQKRTVIGTNWIANAIKECRIQESEYRTRATTEERCDVDLTAGTIRICGDPVCAHRWNFRSIYKMARFSEMTRN